MTDVEIQASRYEHWLTSMALRRQVYAGTPSRIGPCFVIPGYEASLWDHANDRPFRRPRRKA